MGEVGLVGVGLGDVGTGLVGLGDVGRHRLLVHLLLNTNMVCHLMNHVEGHCKVAIPIRTSIDTKSWLFLAFVLVAEPQGYQLPGIMPYPGCFWLLFRLQSLRGIMLLSLTRRDLVIIGLLDYWIKELIEYYQILTNQG